eukprot:CAMPEP_0170580888 /NCGR_PEP_ID=MMETSP0224-20130122/6746_1 /TAXON_ID=285029 /ORGANISM="Togula jolla, Strain CCCM 725" /LENGTH=301 /DNA_ID=CAMNT_0010903987 /DNA_START=39 /DNA_END=944 /DNA_ORIENTATION=-
MTTSEALSIPNISGSCDNPIFETHWAGKSDIRHLNGQPTAQFGLRRCPRYNDHFACCPAAFEKELDISFKHWVEHWQRKVNELHAFEVEVKGVMASQAFVSAHWAERALLSKVLESMQPVVESYGTCFNTLLEYMAGMLCFCCDPNWSEKVFMDSAGHINHLQIHESSNEAIWQACRSLGDAAAELQLRAADSTLAKMIRVDFVDLAAFSTRISVSEHMASKGLIVMRGPNEKLLKEPDSQTRALSTPSRPEGYVDPVRDGRASGFQCGIFAWRTPASAGTTSLYRSVHPFLILLLLVATT